MTRFAIQKDEIGYLLIDGVKFSIYPLADETAIVCQGDASRVRLQIRRVNGGANSKPSNPDWTPTIPPIFNRFGGGFSR